MGDTKERFEVRISFYKSHSKYPYFLKLGFYFTEKKNVRSISEVDSLRYYTHLEDFIKNLYTQIDINSPENLNLNLISKKLDIKIFYWEEKSQAIFYDDMSVIFIDSRISFEKQWQEFSHELCHVLTHTGDQIIMPSLFREYQEFKANNFMYHACIPTFMLDKLNIYDLNAVTVSKIQQLFKVEYDFAKIRMENYLNQKYHVLH